MSKLDPYLLIALGDGWQDHFPTRPTAGELFDVIMQLSDGQGAVRDLRHLAAGSAAIRLNEAHLDAGSPFVTARLDAAAIRQLEAQNFVLRIECAQPLLPRRPMPASSAAQKPGAQPTSARPAGARASGGAPRVLAASIDHGCPFAHREFRDASGATRIMTLWDQDPTPEFSASRAGAPAAFLDGREIRAPEMDGWIAKSHGNEAACYEHAGYSALGVPVTHGSHLLGRFAGRTWGASGALDAAAHADIAFVQLPRKILQAPSAGAVHRCILDGLRYLRNYAQEQGYDRCVVICAYGSYLGPHDGSSLFEQALDAFLREAGTLFQIVFPAGNCAEDSLHFVFAPKPHTTALVEWNLPSDNETATYAELWLPAGPEGEAVEVFLRHGGADVAIDASAGGRLPDWLSAVRQKQRDGQTQIVFRAAMTASAGLQTAPAGKVVLGLKTESAPAQALHGYLCWGGENIGFARRMRQAWWTVPAGSAAVVSGHGTLGGSSCGEHKEIYVAGGYVGHNVPDRRMRASYSSIGPSRGAHRVGPDVLALVEQDSATPGIPGPGTSSAGVGYLSGTSVAVPLVARALLNREDLKTHLKTQAINPRNESVEEVGLGYLD